MSMVNGLGNIVRDGALARCEQMIHFPKHL